MHPLYPKIVNALTRGKSKTSPASQVDLKDKWRNLCRQGAVNPDLFPSPEGRSRPRASVGEAGAPGGSPEGEGDPSGQAPTHSDAAEVPSVEAMPHPGAGERQSNGLGKSERCNVKKCGLFVLLLLLMSWGWQRCCRREMCWCVIGRKVDTLTCLGLAHFPLHGSMQSVISALWESNLKRAESSAA